MLVQKLYISVTIHSIALTCPQEHSAYKVLPDHNMEVSRDLPFLVSISFISICILLCGVKTMLGVLFMSYIPACWWSIECILTIVAFCFPPISCGNYYRMWERFKMGFIKCEQSYQMSRLWIFDLFVYLFI